MAEHATLGEHGDHSHWRRAAARRALLPVAIALIGIAGVVAGDGTLRIVAWGVIAVAITVAIALVFLEVGYSEDRARDSANASPATPRPPSATRPRKAPPDRQGRRRT